MSEARGRAAWARTAAILALLANVYRDPRKTGVFSPADFNPYQRPQGTEVIQADVSVLKVFVDNKL